MLLKMPWTTCWIVDSAISCRGVSTRGIKWQHRFYVNMTTFLSDVVAEVSFKIAKNSMNISKMVSQIWFWSMKSSKMSSHHVIRIFWNGGLKEAGWHREIIFSLVHFNYIAVATKEFIAVFPIRRHCILRLMPKNSLEKVWYQNSGFFFLLQQQIHPFVSVLSVWYFTKTSHQIAMLRAICWTRTRYCWSWRVCAAKPNDAIPGIPGQSS